MIRARSGKLWPLRSVARTAVSRQFRWLCGCKQGRPGHTRRDQSYSIGFVEDCVCASANEAVAKISPALINAGEMCHNARRMTTPFRLALSVFHWAIHAWETCGVFLRKDSCDIITAKRLRLDDSEARWRLWRELDYGHWQTRRAETLPSNHADPGAYRFISK